MEQLKQLGYENMTDEVAITTKTKERYFSADLLLRSNVRQIFSIVDMAMDVFKQ